MSAESKLARQNLVKALKGATRAGDQVFTNSPHPVPEDKLPGILISVLGEDVEVFEEAPRRYRHLLEFAIQFAVEQEKQSEDLDDLLADFDEEILQALFADQHLAGALSEPLTVSELAVARSKDGSKARGLGLRVIECVYKREAPEAVPEEAGRLDQVHVTTDFPPPDGTAEAEDQIDLEEPPAAASDFLKCTRVFCWHEEGEKYGPTEGGTTPVRGLYDSADPVVQEDQRQDWVELGIGVALFSYWGLSPNQWHAHIKSAIDGYFTRLELGISSPPATEDVRGAIFFEQITVDSTWAAEKAQIQAYAASPAYYHHQGKPLLFLYDRAWQAMTQPELDDAIATFFVVIVNPGSVAAWPSGVGINWFNVPWQTTAEYQAHLQEVFDDPGKELWADVNHGFDNRLSKVPGTYWPFDEPGFPNGPTVAWLDFQHGLARTYQAVAEVFTQNESTEHTSTTEPTVEYGDWAFQRIRDY